MKIIAGRSNLELAKSIAEHCFIKVVPANIGAFADGECSVELLENVRGEDCFVIQSTSTPVNDTGSAYITATGGNPPRNVFPGVPLIVEKPGTPRFQIR